MSESRDNNMVVETIEGEGGSRVDVEVEPKCRPVGSEEDDSALSGRSDKLRTRCRLIVDEDIGENCRIDKEQLERKQKKTRRRKAKRKNPYQKQLTDNRGKKGMRFRDSKSIYEQPVAPYNSNRFLIEDHNDLQDFDVKLMAVANRLNGGEVKEGGEGELGNGGGDGPGDVIRRTGRIRDLSFTSAESDEDFFYSSPEDEEEFLCKEFSNTYRDLHVESLTNMSKPELIQTILQLEEKVDSLQKRLDSEEGEQGSVNEGSKSSSTDQSVQFQTEISKLVLANQRLTTENAKLREKGNSSTASSEDSESDSSSSSANSETDEGGGGSGGKNDKTPGDSFLRINGEDSSIVDN